MAEGLAAMLVGIQKELMTWGSMDINEAYLVIRKAFESN